MFLVHFLMHIKCESVWLRFCLFFVFFVSASCSAATCSRANPDFLRGARGISVGSSLEDVRESVWTAYPKDSDYQLIRRLGFDLVRIPVNWASHAELTSPYAIDPDFFRRVDHVINSALRSGLYVVLDFHQYTAASRLGDQELDRFVGIWRQVSSRYAAYSDKLIFELLNEPNGKLDGPEWNRWIELGLAAIREKNGSRIVVISPAKWSNIEGLSDLRVACDFYSVLSFHYYRPFRFTHQGVWWNKMASNWVGTEWPGVQGDLEDVARDFADVARWAGDQGFHGVFLGEFGVYGSADRASRSRWVRAVRLAAEKSGFGWAYWSLRRDFGLLVDDTDRVDPVIVDALFR